MREENREERENWKSVITISRHGDRASKSRIGAVFYYRHLVHVFGILHSPKGELPGQRSDFSIHTVKTPALADKKFYYYLKLTSLVH